VKRPGEEVVSGQGAEETENRQKTTTEEGHVEGEEDLEDHRDSRLE
jgi:hypothetical protein